ncbi:MAG: S8 family serine peptidase, partial [Halobacteriota archaeon]
MKTPSLRQVFLLVLCLSLSLAPVAQAVGVDSVATAPDSSANPTSAPVGSGTAPTAVPASSATSPQVERADRHGSRASNATNRTDLAPGEIRAAPTSRQNAESVAPVEVVVVATDSASTNASALRAVGADVLDRHESRVRVRTSPAAVESIRRLPWVESVHRPYPTASTDISGGVAVVGADDVHAMNITGENVTIGVLDNGFDVTHPEIADNVVDSEAFGGTTVASRSDHGTAVAEIVAETSPNSSLYLAAFTGGTGYGNAVDWLVEQDVDVVVMSMAFFGQPGDGTGWIAQKAASAVDSGAVWVNAAGNYRQDHWQGQFTDTDADGYHEFAPGDEVIGLNDNRNLSAGSRIYVSVNWGGQGATGDYDMYLVREENQSSETIRKFPDQTGQEGYEYLDTTAPSDGRYGVVIEQDGSAPPAPLELYTISGGSPEYIVEEGSVTAPSTSPDVVSVGAFHYDSGELESFSSVGPTADGRLGVDVIAPDGAFSDAYGGRFYGTSAAAPYAGGIAALTVASRPSMTTADVQRHLRRTATDVDVSGPDSRTGYGRVDAEAAVSTPVEWTLTGRLLRPDDSGASNRYVAASRPNGTVVADGYTDDEGSFSLAVPENETVDLAFFQRSASGDESYPRDGVPDVYAFERIETDSSTDFGDVSLPSGAPVTVAVTDDVGDPVSDANVTFTHTESGTASAELGASTGNDGIAAVGSAS